MTASSADSLVECLASRDACGDTLVLQTDDVCSGTSAMDKVTTDGYLRQDLYDNTTNTTPNTTTNNHHHHTTHLCVINVSLINYSEAHYK